jgi:hypothetical protein
MYSDYARKMLNENFRNAFYIGRYRIGDDEDKKPHKFFYIGYRDAFGVAMPEGKNRWGFQIWGISWVQGRTTKLDKAIAKAMKGKFIDCRHNAQLLKRATHGQEFIKPTRMQYPPTTTTAKKTAEEKLPLRRRKRTRRKLL